ncbi:amino acid transporter [Streptococcus sp. 15.1]|jgi:amino acid transporter|uniref:amino acid transporter n=1 Tax=Streptococcus sp. 15.1 TaxID=2762569 RepID=UPI0019127348|nr:amino acid transporter [Streptococcus sp. 15.1]MBK5034523.1 amino acid transporter [Streptococcus sp. 15.1]
MSLFKSVFKSVFKRKDVNIFLTFAFLPILVPLLSGFMEGMSSEYTGSFISFLESAVSTQYRFVLPVLLFSLVVSSVFKDEIDSGIMFLYKDINRKKIFNAKLLSLVVVYSIFLGLTIFMSLVSYYGFMLPKGEVSANFISNQSSATIKSLFTLISTINLNLITIALVVMVSITSKTIKSVLAGVFFSLAASVSPMLIGIQYLFPNGYIHFIRSNWILAYMAAVVISIIYFVIFYVRGMHKFKNVEF